LHRHAFSFVVDLTRFVSVCAALPVQKPERMQRCSMTKITKSILAAAPVVAVLAFMLYGAYDAREVTHPRCEVFVPNYLGQIKAAQQPNETQRKWFKMCGGDPDNPLAPIVEK
jgi:hypothetical protein